MPWEEKLAASPHLGEPWSYAAYSVEPLEHDIAELAVTINNDQSDLQRKAADSKMKMMFLVPRVGVV